MRLLLATLGLAACAGAHDVHAEFPGSPSDFNATLELRFTGAVDHTSVSVNGTPVVVDERTGRVVIAGIPPGQVSVVLAGDGLEKAFAVDLAAGQHMVVPLAAHPQPAAASALLQALLTVCVYAAYLGLAAMI